MKTVSLLQSAKIQTPKCSHIFIPFESAYWLYQKSHIQKILKPCLKYIDNQKMNEILAKN